MLDHRLDRQSRTIGADFTFFINSIIVYHFSSVVSCQFIRSGSVDQVIVSHVFHSSVDSSLFSYDDKVHGTLRLATKL